MFCRLEKYVRKKLGKGPVENWARMNVGCCTSYLNMQLTYLIFTNSERVVIYWQRMDTAKL
jgi:hypothetical protein